jgi:hypothetical protein
LRRRWRDATVFPQELIVNFHFSFFREKKSDGFERFTEGNIRTYFLGD